MIVSIFRFFTLLRLNQQRNLGLAGAAVLGALLGATQMEAQSLERNSVSTPQTANADRIIVTGEGVASAYGAPASFSRSRFANLTTAYVLPPYAVYAGLIYEGDALRYQHPDHLFTQEIEVGLPYRFGVAVENTVQSFRGRGQDASFSVEGRYALADWNKIPLNPTLFAEYRFGIGDILHDEGAPMRLDKGEGPAAARQTTAHVPDAIELRLLLAQDFFKDRLEAALSLFFEQEVGGDRGREYGFAQSLLTPVLLSRERLKVGLEMQYRSFTDKGSRNDPTHGFVLGPTVAFKPTRNTRFDVSPLFGVTFDAPRVQAFAVFSYTFGPGGGEGQEAEAPASTRNR